jgi:hypothetical protein
VASRDVRTVVLCDGEVAQGVILAAAAPNKERIAGAAPRPTHKTPHERAPSRAGMRRVSYGGQTKSRKIFLHLLTSLVLP